MQQRQLLLKCLLLACLGLVLTVPLALIKATIEDRIKYRDEAVQAIASSSAGRQLLTGPVLAVPVQEDYEDEEASPTDSEKATRVVRRRRTLTVTLFPKMLHINGIMKAERRAYGIHSTAVYGLHATIDGLFDPPTEADLPSRGRNSTLTWGHPRLVIGIGDVRGLITEPKLRIDDEQLVAAHGTRPTSLGPGFGGELSRVGLPVKALPFEVEFDLAGTESFSIVPLAGLTTAELRSNWPDPSFGGSFLPRERTVDQHGFEAHWAVSGLATGSQRESPGQATAGPGDGPPSLSVRLIDPVDVYRLAVRAVKYGVLFVVVIFAAFFAFEIIISLPIHPVQYALVGLAQAMFFLLLVSLSEHTRFAVAYVAAAAGSVALIVAYLAAVLRSVRRALGVGGALALLYTALFGVLQSEDNALLLGSLLLFAILAALMLGTRRVDWYQISVPVPQPRAGPA